MVRLRGTTSEIQYERLVMLTAGVMRHAPPTTKNRRTPAPRKSARKIVVSFTASSSGKHLTLRSANDKHDGDHSNGLPAILRQHNHTSQVTCLSRRPGGHATADAAEKIEDGSIICGIIVNNGTVNAGAQHLLTH